MTYQCSFCGAVLDFDKIAKTMDFKTRMIYKIDPLEVAKQTIKYPEVLSGCRSSSTGNHHWVRIE